MHKAERQFSLPENTARLLLLLEYNGAAYSGNVVQPNATTVESELRRVFNSLGIVQHSPFHFSGRTDAGVHAKAIWAQVTAPINTQERFEALKATLNALLPKTIRVRDVEWCLDEAFHVTVCAQWRWYRYRLLNQAHQSATLSPDIAFEPLKLDIDAMNKAASHLLGPHNFASFQCENGNNTHANCTLIQAQWQQDSSSPDPILNFDIIGNRFVYKMVRSIVGTLIETGKNSRKPSDIKAILAQQGREHAGQSAPANGLTLMTAYYGANTPFFQKDVYVSMLTNQVQCLTLVEV